MKPRKPRLNDAQQSWVRDWWRALQPREEGDSPLPGELWAMGRGQRAQLRRCAGVDELLVHAATLLLADRLVALNGEQGALPDEARSYERMAWVAGVLALVKTDLKDGQSLAWHLGENRGKERSPMSELRFKTLQRSRNSLDMFKQWRRAVQLAGGQADVARLADDLLSWQIESAAPGMPASQGVKFRWAYDYYLSDREQGAAQDPKLNKELSQ